jgi:hypothetical protein
MKHTELDANLQLKPEKFRLEVGAGPLILDVIAVIDA